MSYPERIRSRGGLSPATIKRLRVDSQWITTAPTASTFTTVIGIGKEQTILDNYSKGWKPGVFRLNPVEFRSRSVRGTASTIEIPFYLGSFYRWKWVKLQGMLALASFVSWPTGFSSPGPTVTDSTRKDMALQAAYAGVNSPQVEVGVMLAEARETLNLLVSPLGALQKRMKRLLKRRTSLNRSGPKNGPPFRKLRKLPDYATNAWLQERYGIMPLLRDISDLRKAYENAFTEDLHVLRRSSGGTTYGQKKTIVEQLVSIGGSTGITCTARDVTEEDTRALAKVFYNRRVHRFSYSGLDPLDIPNTLWELVPLSFVVDWFVDLGTWFSVIKPVPGLDYLGNCVTTVTRKTLTRNLLRARDINQTQAPFVPCDGFCEIKTSQMKREINLPIPVLPIWNPGFESIVHGIDALSLIWQNMPKLKR